MNKLDQKILAILGILIILCVGGFFIYRRSSSSEPKLEGITCKFGSKISWKSIKKKVQDTWISKGKDSCNITVMRLKQDKSSDKSMQARTTHAYRVYNEAKESAGYAEQEHERIAFQTEGKEKKQIQGGKMTWTKSEEKHLVSTIYMLVNLEKEETYIIIFEDKREDPAKPSKTFTERHNQFKKTLSLKSPAIFTGGELLITEQLVEDNISDAGIDKIKEELNFSDEELASLRKRYEKYTKK